MIGLPGSGKSFLAQKLINHHPNYQLISTDAIRAKLFGDEAIQGPWLKVWAEIQQQFHQAVLQASDTIYDATNAQRSQRRDIIILAREIGFSPILGLWVDPPLELCLMRNQNRFRQVPEAVILRMYRQMVDAPPSLNDQLDSLIVVESLIADC